MALTFYDVEDFRDSKSIYICLGKANENSMINNEVCRKLVVSV